MDVVNARCAGLDVHQATVVATVRVPAEKRGRRVVTETFGTMTPDLLALRDWLQAFGVTHVALESTGVYWKPVYYVLEDACTLLLINMQELKHVPGRKTDVKDSEWLAQLLEYGLLRASFVPPPEIRELRDLTRYRAQQARDRTREVNRLCKVLEDAGLKLTTVITDVMGASGRAMLAALVQGTTDPAVLAELSQGKLRKKLPDLRRALQGRFQPHHAFLLEQILAKIDFVDETIERLTAELDRRLVPFESMLAALDTIPGVDRATATIIVAETGGAMTRKGNRYLRATLIQAALAATRKKNSALQARYLRVKRHGGHKKAVVAVGHQMLEIAYYVMRDGVAYHELGADYLDRRHADRVARRHVRQLEALGFEVTITKAA
jgi:transposase